MTRILIAALMIVSAKAEQLRIVVYDDAGLPSAITGNALENLRRIFRQSKIDIEWSVGNLAEDEASLVLYPEATRKGREQEVACRARRDIALKIYSSVSLDSRKLVLGMAQPLASAGLNVQIYWDRIRDVSTNRGLEPEVLLAHAIAHEIGHVLLRSNGHSRSGVMTEVWTDNQYGLMARGLVYFHGDESKRIRSTLAGVGCDAQVEAK